MALKDYVTGPTNKILIGTGGIGLIITAIVGLSGRTPAYQTRNSSGQNTWNVSIDGTSVQSGSITTKNLINCNTIDTTSTGMLICGNDATGAGGGSNFGTGNVVTIGDSKYVNIGGDTMTGSLTINITGGTQKTVGLKVLNTLSGASIHAESILTSSGTFITEGEARMNSGATINGRVTFVGYSSTPQITAADPDTGIHFDGPGIVSIHNGGTQTMLLSSTNRVGIGSGAPKTKLEVVGTISGSSIYAASGLSTSGSLTVNGTTSGSFIRGFGLITDCDTAGTSKLLWDSTLGRFSCGTDTDTTYTAGQGLTLNGTSFRMNAAITGSSIRVAGTVSGSLAVLSSLRSCTLKTGGTGNVICGSDLNSDLFNTGSILSAGDRKYVNIGGDTMTGTLTVTPVSGVALNARGTISGSAITISSLSGCDTIDTDAQGNFVCGTDATGGSGSPEVGTSSFSGAVVRLGNTQYVKKGGDTMTGTLVINPSSGLAARLYGSLSGSYARFQISGDQYVELANNVTNQAGVFRNSNLRIDLADGGNNIGMSATDGVNALRFADGGNNVGFVMGNGTNTGVIIDGANNVTSSYTDGTNTVKILDGGNNNLFSIEGASSFLFLNAVGNLGIGTDAPQTPLEVVGTVSGSTLYAARSLRSSGSLVWEGSASGALLWVSKFEGAGLSDCDDGVNSKLLWDATTDRFSCGTDQGGAAGLSQASADLRYVNVAGDTMTGALIIQSGNAAAVSSIPLLTVRGTMSGVGLVVSGTGSRSPLLFADQSTRRVTINTSGTGNVIGTSTGQTLTSFNIINSLGTAIFRVFDDGRVWAGRQRSFTGALELGSHPVMGRSTGWSAPTSTTATAPTSFGAFPTLTATGNVSAAPAAIINTNSKNVILRSAPNVTNGVGGLFSGTTNFLDVYSNSQPRLSLAMRTSTGTTNLRYAFGLTSHRTLLQQAFPLASTPLATISYIALAWEDGVNGTQWMCCSGNATNHSCRSMGVTVKTTTNYLLSVDWAERSAPACIIIEGNTQTRVVKTDNIPSSTIGVGPFAGILQKATGNNARTWYFSRMSLDQN